MIEEMFGVESKILHPYERFYTTQGKILSTPAKDSTLGCLDSFWGWIESFTSTDVLENDDLIQNYRFNHKKWDNNYEL